MQTLRNNGIFVDGFPASRFRQNGKKTTVRSQKASSQPKNEPLLLLTHFHGDSIGHVPKTVRSVLAPSQRKEHTGKNRPMPDLPLPASDASVFRRSLRPLQPVLATDGSRITAVPFKTEHCDESLGFWFPQLRILYVGDSRISVEQLERCDAAVRFSHHQPADVRTVIGDGLFHTCAVRFPPLSMSALWLATAFRRAAEAEVAVQFVCYHSGVLDLLQNALQLLTGTEPAFPEVQPELTAESGDVWKTNLVSSVRQTLRRWRTVQPSTAKTQGTTASIPLRLHLVSRRFGSQLAKRDAECRDGWVAVNPASHGSGWIRNVQRSERKTLTVSTSALFFAVASQPAVVAADWCWNAETQHLRIRTSFHATQEENAELLRHFGNARFEACPSRPL